MKRYILAFAFQPLLSFGQTSINTTQPTVVAMQDGYNISGTLLGFADNTTIDIINPNSGASEASGKIVNGTFTLKGKMAAPDFRIVAINSQPPYLSIFLDNSNVAIKGNKEGFDKSEIKGSASHSDFAEFSKVAKPYEPLFNQPDAADAATLKKAAGEFEQFITAHPNSYISPLAIYRHHQLTADNDKLEAMYNKLPAATQQASIGAYLATLIKESKKNPIGKPLANFSQADAEGKEVSLSSFRGKYVLVDFWASWCGPCRQENPNIVATYQKYKSKNFTVLGVSLDKAKAPWLEAIKADGLTWTHLSDLKGWNNAVAQQFEIFSIPQSFLLDPNGNIVGKNLRGPALEAKLASLIK